MSNTKMHNIWTKMQKNARKDAGYFSHAPITIWFYLLLLLIFFCLSTPNIHIRNISCLKSDGIILILLDFNYHLTIQISALTFFPPYFSYSPYAFCWLYITPRSVPLSSLSFPCFSWIFLLLIFSLLWMEGFFASYIPSALYDEAYNFLNSIGDIKPLL